MTEQPRHKIVPLAEKHMVDQELSGITTRSQEARRLLNENVLIY